MSLSTRHFSRQRVSTDLNSSCRNLCLRKSEVTEYPGKSTTNALQLVTTRVSRGSEMRYTEPSHLSTVLIVNLIVYISGKTYPMHLTLRTLMMHLSYVKASTWDTLVHEVLECSTVDSPFDEMVQLYDARMRRPPPRPQPTAVRRIFYSDISQISNVLTPHLPAAAPRSQEPSLPDTAIEQVEDSRERDTSGEDTADNSPPNLDGGLIMPKDETDAFAQHAQEKLDSTRIIAEVYSSYALRKKGRLSDKMTPADTIHRRYIKEYRSAYMWDVSMEEPHKRYRLLLIISLPYGLTLLELAREHLYETRRRVKTRVNAGDQFDHEDYSSAMTRCK